MGEAAPRVARVAVTRRMNETMLAGSGRYWYFENRGWIRVLALEVELVNWMIKTSLF